MLDLFREIGQSLSHNKTRTALTGLAVAWGIFMLIVLLGMARGVVNAFESGPMGSKANSMMVFPGRTSMPYKGYKEGRVISLEQADPQRVVDDNRNVGVAQSYPVKHSSGAQVISGEKEYISSGYNGVYPKQIDLDNSTMIAGRFVNQADINQARKVMVICEDHAKLLFGTVDDAIGRYLNSNGLVFTVIGVYRNEWRQDVYIPFTTAAHLNAADNHISNMVVILDGVETEEAGKQVETAVRQSLAAAHGFSPDDDAGVWIWNRLVNYLTQSKGLNILNIAMWLIGLLTMLSGIVGVSNIMFVSVRERTHEIGIRRAIGAKPRSILMQIVVESVCITALFGYIGIVLGVGVDELLSLAFQGQQWIKNPSVDLSIALQVTVVLVVAGAVAGIFPAMKALKVKPVEALRDE